VINTLAYADYDIVSKIAAELGNAHDCDLYRARAQALRSAMNARLMNAQEIYVDGLDASGAQSAHVSQHANMLPLALGIVPAEKRAGVMRHVKALRMGVGMVTVRWLIQALGEMDEGEHLIDLYTQGAWDGWAGAIAKGATCAWESWDADSGGNLSQSHPWGAVGLCGIQQYILGVKPLAPQFEKVQVKPLSFGAKLTRASGKLPTDRGDIAVSWEWSDSGFRMTVTLPPNVQAKVYVPKADASAAPVKVDGANVTGVAEGNTLSVDNIGSGTHSFERAVAPSGSHA
jgi:alpha-L-rhamnosidase